MELAGITGATDSIYTIKQTGSTSNTEYYHARYSMMLEIDSDVILVERSVFNFFVLLSDVGGLYGLGISCFSTLLLVFNY